MKNKNIQILFLSSLIFLSGGLAQARFADVDVTHPYFHAIDDLQDRGIIEGYEKGGSRFFKPLQPISRAEVLKVLILAAEIPLVEENPHYFADVPLEAWYSIYVNTAADLDIVQGFADGDFHPQSQVSRAEFLKMLVRSFGIPETDKQETDSWYDPFFRVAKELRILNSEESPYESISRGEIAELIYRASTVSKSDFTEKYIFEGQGKASFYNEGFAGNKTASGEIYNPQDLTAAHRTLPFGTYLKVSYEDKYVIVRINDRGPYHQNRILDLSEKAFESLAPISRGVLEVEYKVVSTPTDTQVVIPESIRSELSTSTTENIPGAIREKLEELRQDPDTSVLDRNPETPLFSETISHLTPDFFKKAILRDSFPQKIVAGTVMIFSGIAEQDGYETATVFLQKKDSESDQIHYSGPVSGRNFSFPIYFLEPGIYQMGLIFDKEKRSRVGEIEVVSIHKERRFSASPDKFSTELDYRIIPEEKRVEFSWEVSPETVVKLVFSQEKHYQKLFVEDDIKNISLPFSFFEEFIPSQNLAIDIFMAKADKSDLQTQNTNWKSAGFDNLELLPGFPDTETDSISIYNFPRFIKNLDEVIIKGKLLSSKYELKETAYITNPRGFVEEFPVKDLGYDEFQINIPLEEWGIYILEIVSSQGEILFNRGIYVSRNLVLPVFPWPQTSATGTSVPGIRHWTNKIRQQQGITTLQADKDLNSLAQSYAEEMAATGFISHTSPLGLTFQDRIKRAGLQGEFGENLSYGTSLELALGGLENSGSHRANILRRKWTKVGIGLAQNKKGEFYITQVFGK